MFSRVLEPPKASFFLFGPRGTGKSTWIRDQFPGIRAFDLLRTSETIRLSRDPSLLRQELQKVPAKTWIAIDEVQKVPALLDEVHALIEDKKLRFILSGSSARKLKRGAANLLAGRARTETMFPLISNELGDSFDLRRALEFGTLPLAVTEDDPAAFLVAYAETYLKEEIQAEALTRNLGGFSRFLEVAARQNGQITNMSNIARDAQVARQTVQGYFDVLCDTLIGFFLEAWKLKRATKQVAHPKFYFFDPGVARVLAGRIAYPVPSEQMGFQLETLLLSEIRAYIAYRRLRYPCFFWSSPDGVEVDLLVEDKRGFLAVEMRSATRWETKFLKGLVRIREELKGVRPIGVFLGDRSLHIDGVEVLPATEFLSRLWAGEVIR